MSDRRRQFRCSQLPQLMACPGSALLRERVKPSKSGAVAALGTWCHWMAATELVREHGATPPEAGLPEPPMRAGWKPTGFDLWMIRFYVAEVLDRVGADMALEVEAEFKHSFARFDLSGHIDTFGITADATEAIGFDLKTGSVVVDEAKDNAQVLGYIVLLALAYPTLRKITFAVVQPRNHEDDGEQRVSMITLEGEQIAQAVAYVERTLNTAIDEEMTVNSDGGKQCRYCPAALQCPAVEADLSHMKMTLTPEYLNGIAAEPTIDRLLAVALAGRKLSPLLKDAADILKQRIRDKGEQTVDGYRVFVQSQPGIRVVTDNAKARVQLGDLPDALFDRCYQFKPGEIEEVLAEHESARTGLKVPVDTKTAGKVSGKSMMRDRIGHVMQQGEREILKIVEVAS